MRIEWLVPFAGLWIGTRSDVEANGERSGMPAFAGAKMRFCSYYVNEPECLIEVSGPVLVGLALGIVWL